MNYDEIDRNSLRDMQMKIMENVAASALIPLMRIGDELGLFTVLADGGPMDIPSFASAANIDERYCEEWVLAMSAAGEPTRGRLVASVAITAATGAVSVAETETSYSCGKAVKDTTDRTKMGKGIRSSCGGFVQTAVPSE